MSPIPPSDMLPILPSEWTLSDWELRQLPDLREKCPICGNVLENLHKAIGGFPDHERVHPGSLVGYNCYECMRHFTPDEILSVKEKKTRRGMLAKDYWKDVRAIFREPALYIVVIGFMLLRHSFWAEIVICVVVVLLMPFLAKSLEKVFAPLIIKLVRKKFESPPSDKPSDSPKTP